MKLLRLALVCALFSLSHAFANSLDTFIDALQNGKKEGDINLLFDYLAQNGNANKGAYLATTFGLYYQSQFYGYFRLNIGFRGALPLWQQHKNNASRDLWRGNRAMIARSNLEYFDGDTMIKAGRIEDKLDMVDRHFDGLIISNKSLGFVLFEGAFMNQFGRVLDRELSGFENIKRYGANGANLGNSRYGGAYYFGANFEIIEGLNAKAYLLTSPTIYTFLAGKAEFNSTYLFADLGYVAGFEHKYSYFRAVYNNHYSHLIHATVGAKYDSQWGEFYGKVGYRNTSNNAGIGSLAISGNSFNPFFYFSGNASGGNALNTQKAVHLGYFTLGYKVDFLNVYLTYGYNSFKPFNARKSRDGQGEVDLYFDWKFSRFTSVIVYLINTHSAKAIPNYTQVGAMFKVEI